MLYDTFRGKIDRSPDNPINGFKDLGSKWIYKKRNWKPADQS